MVKRLICFAVILIFSFSLPVLAENDFSIQPDGEFEIYNEETGKSVISSMSAEELKEYCNKKNIIYLATNKANTKQIRISCSETAFSESVNNLSDLSKNEITKLIPDIIGSEKVKGTIIKKDMQDFIKTEISTSDSGGEYTVTQFITVAGGLDYTLSFYTAVSENKDYIEKTFKTFNTKDFYTSENHDFLFKVVVPVSVAVFVGTVVFIAYTIIRDLRKTKENV